MKHGFFTVVMASTIVALSSCNDDSKNTSGNPDSVSSAGPDSMRSTPAETDNTTTTTPQTMGAPLNKADSTFVMNAAVGGMTEVESGNVATMNSTNDRVKSFANMMITDHTKANGELASFAQGRGLSVPTALPADKQKHVDGMKAMKGKSFDKHYAGMMVTDHQKTVDMFKKESSTTKDADLKAWVDKTLPTLQMHLDSIKAINNSLR